MASTNGLYTKKIVNWIWIWGFNTRPIKKWTGTIWGNINLCCLKAGHLAKWIKMVSQKNSRTGMATKWSVMDVEKIRGSWNLFRIKTDVVYPRAFRPKKCKEQIFLRFMEGKEQTKPYRKKDEDVVGLPKFPSPIESNWILRMDLYGIHWNWLDSFRIKNKSRSPLIC